MSPVTNFYKHKLRGNPLALSVILVSIILLILAVVLLKWEGPEILVGALVGASVSSFTGLLIGFLSNPPEKRIPINFISTAEDDLKIGYYRSNSIIYIILKEEERKLDFIVQSDIIPLGRGVTMKAKLGLEKHNNMEVSGSPEYLINAEKKPINSSVDIPLSGNATEYLKITYDITDDFKSPLEDDHIWSSPLDQYEVVADIPDGFTLELISLKGDTPRGLLQVISHKPGISRYIQSSGVFSRQGFRWLISKDKITA